MSRRKIIAGNWKMNQTGTEGRALAEAFVKEIGNFDGGDIVLCTPFTTLGAVSAAIAASPNIALGAQNMYHQKSGAYTGEISASMLLDAGCKYVILGHSERRQYFGETDASINQKALVALAAGLTPIVCVGETLDVRDAGNTQKLVCEQVAGSYASFTVEQLLKTVIAYEPVWAIGTGRTASPAQAQEVHAWIRAKLTELFGTEAAQQVRIQYGGSVKADNAAELMSQPDVDGALVGGAALDAVGFAAIVRKGCGA